MRGLRARVTRDQLCNDCVNTGTLGAFLGGFALTSLDRDHAGRAATAELTVSDKGIAVYVTACLAVHACTCAALTSAVAYRALNRMPTDGEASRWAAQPLIKLILALPFAKFAMGCVSYLLSVLLLSWHQLGGGDVAAALGLTEARARGLTLFIGLMSMSVALTSMFLLERSARAVRRRGYAK